MIISIMNASTEAHTLKMVFLLLSDITQYMHNSDISIDIGNENSAEIGLEIFVAKLRLKFMDILIKKSAEAA